ncbi:MAG: DUF2804 domain-containing protein [Candidatus Helarchaeales archaeon]
MQHEITEPSDLLNENGELIQRGWARKPILRYNPENLGVGWHRRKEWDYYGIWNLKHGISFFIADLGYMTLATLTVYDFTGKKSSSKTSLKLFTRGKLGLSRNSLEGDFTFSSRSMGKLEIKRLSDKQVLSFDAPKFKKLKGEIELAIDQSKDSMVVATGYPPDRPHHFYYNHKFNNLPATGELSFNGRKLEFNPEDSFGGFDWGRGVWPYKTRWLWGTGAGKVDGHEIWFNIGYGFGDLSTHTENMIFYDGKCHKIDQVTFNYDEKDVESPWNFTSNDGRLELVMDPILPEPSSLNLGLLRLKIKKAHGLFSGTLKLDDGTKLEVENLLGHAEDCRFRW